MLTLLVLAQIASAAAPPPSPYSSDALRAFIATASEANRVPASLAGYRARVQSELSFVLHDSVGREQATQIEQLAANARWTRGGAYDLHVVGYRTQSVGAPFSALSFVDGWTVPTLYGNRLDLGFDPVTRRDSPRARRDTVSAVHPLASNRDRYYRFGGGDTVAVVRTAAGDIPVVRVRVEPVIDSTTRAALFEGDLDFDATRHALVRMRGRFLVFRHQSGKRRPLISRLPGIVAVAYAEFVNAQFDGEFWLPTYQRTEFQAAFASFGDSRSVFRLVSRFSDYDIEHDTLNAAGDSAAPKQRARRRIVSYAPSDSLGGFGNWTTAIGTATSEVSARDFDDLAPSIWQQNGAPRVRFFPRKFDEVFRYNRVEGAYTGASMSVAFRDAAPGVSLRTFGGWAWAEETVRGGGSVTLQRGHSWYAIRAERALALTNDFVRPFEGASAFAAILGSVDDADYVDRRLASASVSAALGALDRGLFTIEARVAEDRPEVRRLEHGPLGGSRAFRMNRGVDAGRYALASVSLELHPNVTGDFLHPGVGARARYEGAVGDLDWQRMELTLAARQNWKRFVFATRADGGLVVGQHLPPQTILELGRAEGLSGYSYKEFAGDRAAVVRGMVGYALPWFTAPLRLWRGYVAPGLSPGLAASVSGGWSDVSTSAAQAAISRLAVVDDDGLPRTPLGTERVRATVDLRLTFLAGTLGFGVARPVDHAAPWRFIFTIGNQF
jgi:hypothetical protein